jgi:hypothetical protein
LLMYSIYPWKHLRTHNFASSKKKRPPLQGMVACTAKKASYAPGSLNWTFYSFASLVIQNDSE